MADIGALTRSLGGSAGIYIGQGIRDDRLKAEADLQKMLQDMQIQREESQRNAELHPGALKKQELGNDSLGISNKAAEQKITNDQAAELRAQQKSDQEQEEAFQKSLPNIAATVSSYPPDMQLAVSKGLLETTKSGKNFLGMMQDGIKKGNIDPRKLGELFSKNAKLAAENSREMQQAKATAQIGADSRAEVAGIRASSAINAADVRNQGALERAQNRYQNELDKITTKATEDKERDRLKDERRAGREKENIKLRNDAMVLKAKVDGGGKASKESLQNMITRLATQVMTETDADKKAELEQWLQWAVGTNIDSNMAGKDQSSPTLVKDPKTDKLGIGEKSRRPPSRNIPGSTASGKITAPPGFTTETLPDGTLKIIRQK